MVSDQLHQIAMVRPNLNDLPDYKLPPQYDVQWYEEGDEKHWVAIQKQTDQYNKISIDVFRKTFGSDIRLLNQRQCYLIAPGGRFVGTATAWFNNDYYGRTIGRIHWVAILPEMQGHGLAKSLLSCICKRLKSLDHRQAYLTTLSIRIPAINLYRKFGFMPDIRTDKDEKIWDKLNKTLGIGNK